MNQYKRNEANSRSSEKGVQLKPGFRLGRYELVSAVGSGGMGRVWAARDTFAPGMRLVAVKTALREAASDPEAERLFTDEARVASLVQHPNVCPVYELGKDHGALYLVMAWCDGGSLREILSSAENLRLSPELSAGIVARVAAGLHAAHELTDADGSLLGVVHRDVSPQNILVTSTGHVMVADFGIARARGQLHRPTETGEIKGKLSYLAPEQITSREFDRRADVFAAGCVLYEASVGARAFHGTDALATMYQILERGVEPPSKLISDYPPELERIVLKALAKSVNDRYQTAEALQLDLEEWLAQSRKVVSERLIADALKGALGPTVAGRNKAIQEAIEAFAKKPNAEEEETVLDEAPRTFSDPAPSDTAPTDTLATLTTSEERPSRPRTKAILAGVGLITGLAAAFIAFSGKPPAPEPVEPRATAATPLTEASPSIPSAPSATAETSTASTAAPTTNTAPVADPLPAPSSTPSARKHTTSSKPRLTPTPEPAVTVKPQEPPPATATTGGGRLRTLDKDNPFEKKND
jgi:serine/threonine-protein kinase